MSQIGVKTQSKLSQIGVKMNQFEEKSFKTSFNIEV